MKESTVKISDHVFNTLVAETAEEQEVGLMFKKTLPSSMSFVYSYPKINKFWMKNTLLPLDIVFCCNGKVIDICKGEPLSTETIGPNSPTDLVVEFPFGTCRQLGIKSGDTVTLPEIEKQNLFKRKYY